MLRTAPELLITTSSAAYLPAVLLPHHHDILALPHLLEGEVVHLWPSTSGQITAGACTDGAIYVAGEGGSEQARQQDEQARAHGSLAAELEGKTQVEKKTSKTRHKNRKTAELNTDMELKFSALSIF
jgi:hypothetical protein